MKAQNWMLFGGIVTQRNGEDAGERVEAGERRGRRTSGVRPSGMRAPHSSHIQYLCPAIIGPWPSGQFIDLHALRRGE